MLEISDKSKKYHDVHSRSELSELLPGMKVLVMEGKTWYPATVKYKNNEPRSYTLTTPNGQEMRRNRKFLRELSQKAVEKFNFKEPTEYSKEEDSECTDEETPKEIVTQQAAKKSVRFNEKKNQLHKVPVEEPQVLEQRPRRNIKKPARYRDDP